MFEEFATRTVRTSEASVFVRYGGEGPPLLLLHGHPRTSATWHRVAPVLVRRGFSVVCPDLRGYGRSRGPAPALDHVPHSKRAVAKDMVEVMQTLGRTSASVSSATTGGLPWRSAWCWTRSPGACTACARWSLSPRRDGGVPPSLNSATPYTGPRGCLHSPGPVVCPDVGQICQIWQIEATSPCFKL